MWRGGRASQDVAVWVGSCGGGGREVCGVAALNVGEREVGGERERERAFDVGGVGKILL